MKLNLIFHDWLSEFGESIYFKEGFEDLTLGDYHHGTTFRAEVEIEEETELRRFLEAGSIPVFIAALPE